MNKAVSIIETGLSRFTGKLKPLLFLLALVASISGCASFNNFFGSSGPSGSKVQDVPKDPQANGIQLVTVDGTVANKLKARRKKNLFSEAFVNAGKSGYVLGAGDAIEVSVWEAPPAMLFGVAASTNPGTAPSTSQKTAFPEQMVNAEGKISIPFVGEISVVGLTLQQIEMKIVKSLKDKANNPQVLVRLSHNNTANVTVIGEVAASARIPLTARGEKLLDVLASVGGVRQPVKEITLQLTRGNQVQALALETVISDPQQNIVLQPGDVITAMVQPLSITVSGATGKNQELGYETKGITLAQAISRVGGLNDATSDAHAVFIFRFEDSKALDWAKSPKLTSEGKVPVIYQVDMTDPASFFVAQNFPMADKDMLYVSNAPSVQLQKFITMVFQSMFILKTFAPSL